MFYAAGIYGLICLAVCALYGIDKRKAIKGGWRIPERTLLIAALLAPAGALAGMILFRHKIRKPLFLILVPLMLAAELLLAAAAAGILAGGRYPAWQLPWQKPEAFRPQQSPETGTVQRAQESSSSQQGQGFSASNHTSEEISEDPPYPAGSYHSQTDMDGDGLDDQTDFLQAVEAYLKTRPRYKSRYYAGGYPDDGYGVCTDVIAFGMREAGYDLMELVDEDIQDGRDLYGIETPDKNIDFRRVVNLKIYFDRHAISLPTDLTDPSQWQAGDIVIFKNHIGVISDRRRKDGIPLLLHHYSPLQAGYEEDAIEKWGPIKGHYRIS